MKVYRTEVLESIATQTIKKYNPALLIGEPKPIPIEELAEFGLKLNMAYHYLSNDGRVLGATMFHNGNFPVYDMEKKEYIWRFIPAHTVVIDERLLKPSNYGRMRFTVAHEVAHWLIHKELYSINEAAAMAKAKVQCKCEHQADYLAAELLMPKGMVKKAFYRLQGAQTIEKLAALFEVSKQAMQIRLRDFRLI